MEVDAGSAPEAAAPTAGAAELVSFKIVFGKDTKDVEREATSTVGELKSEIHKTIGIPNDMQKLLLRGKPLTNDSATLAEVSVHVQ